MENPDTVQKTVGSNRTIDWAVGLNVWSCPKRQEWPKVTNSIWMDGLVFGTIQTVRVFCLSILDCLSDSKSKGGWLNDLGFCRQELRMVLVKPRSREGSVSERLCNVWLDDARDELVIVYETIKKFWFYSF
ncbi:unnamed protein product [Brassica rapa]|uniref:Uncharacterized protein n=1 Tax=Brassica campestris TaxID=3711 RepID=A0A8D9CXA7_BRACM|nr:unnamed protein product [Brassica rapa]